MGSMKTYKKANKKATRGVNKKWRKGQSSSHNPEFNKFRMEAKQRRMFGNRGGSNLTPATLAQHNKLTSDKQCEENDDLMSVGDTAITAFTNCSLPTFSRLITNWNAGSLLHKEMIAVLAAVSDVLKTHGGKETETEYFAALMTTLDVAETDESLTAVICLLSMVVKRLNENVLKLQCDTSCNIFIKLLLKYMNSDHGALLRNLLKIVYIFLKAKNKWCDSTCEKLKVLLEFTVHHKPKVRRVAHQIVRTLLVNCSPELGMVHSGCKVAAEFCMSKLERNGGPNASKDVFYILSLLEETLGIFPKTSLKLLCETILRVMTLSNSMVTSACLKTIKGIFAMNPKPETLPSDLNARLIMALYDYQPNIRESDSLISWLNLMESAFINLKKLDEKLCVSHLPKLYSTVVKCWQNENGVVLEIVSFILKNLIYECIKPSGEVFQQYLMSDAVNNPMHKMFQYVEEALSYQYHKAWRYVLNVLATFFEVMGKHCYTVMLKCLQSLADMHDSYKFSHISELERAIGLAIQHMGPKVVLDAIPLQIDVNSDNPDFPRSWLLPLLRDHIKKTELKFFAEYFMPLAKDLKNKVVSLQQEQKIVLSKFYDILCSQVWSLLPGFCNEPTDLKQSFNEIAETLFWLLKLHPELRIPVLSSLRVLINKNLENDENRKELSKYAEKYLPLLFNLFTTETKDKNEERIRLAVYETCKAYLQITDKELCKTYFEAALQKLMASESTDFKQQSMIDICRAILPYVDPSQIKEIYDYCAPLIKENKNNNHTTQKKCYSVLNEICSSEAESCKLFVKENLENIRPLLCGAVSGLTPATRALRLSILSQIAKQLSITEKEFVVPIVAEAVLCTKENSTKARAAAFNLLIVIGRKFLDWQPTKSKEALYDYFKVLLSNFAENPNPHLISATILAVGRAMYEFKDKMDSHLIHMLMENCCLLLTSKSREVVDAAISFLKILFTVMDNTDLAQHVEFLVKSITSISEDNQRHFRFRAKEVLTRLIRKFGYDMIAKLVPESYQKQVSYIRKMEARKAKKTNASVDDDEDEEDEDDDFEVPSEGKHSEGFDAILANSDDEMPLETDTDEPTKSRKRRANDNTVIEEHGEDDILDLLDPSINQKLLSKKPEKVTVKTVKKTERGFPVAKDGRLIITEDADEMILDDKQDQRKEVLAELGALSKRDKKRKYKESDNEDEDDDEDHKKMDSSSVSKGIHRSLEPKSKKRAPGAEFKAKKAGGDVKKGKLQPYAYVPLNRQMLNKRKQVKVKGQFKSLVKGAKKGAEIGAKRKMRQARRNKNK